MSNFLFQFLQTPEATSSMSQQIMGFLPFILIIVVFYFFMIRPQMKRQKELKKFRDALKKGDKIVTSGGIYGTVSEIKDDAIVIEIAENVKIKVDKSAVIMDMSDANRR